MRRAELSAHLPPAQAGSEAQKQLAWTQA